MRDPPLIPNRYERNRTRERERGTASPGRLAGEVVRVAAAYLGLRRGWLRQGGGADRRWVEAGVEGGSWEGGIGRGPSGGGALVAVD